MKPLVIWLGGLIIVLVAFAIAVNLTRETSRVFVVVDSSFPMTAVWAQVPEALDDIDGRRYAEFALATEKSLVHSWRDELRLGAVSPFAPCDFEEVTTHAEVTEADELILITTSTSCSTEPFQDWEITLLEP